VPPSHPSAVETARPSRRTFLRLSLLGGAALLVEVGCREREPAAAGAEGDIADRPEWKNDWILLHADGRVEYWLAKSEMGQGVATALAMIVAEELDVPLARVAPRSASTQGFFADSPILNTGGSASVRRSWAPLRKAAAYARRALLEAAASTWQVRPSECRTEAGEVIHESSGRRSAYGELLATAAARKVPSGAPRKARERFRIVGHPAPRLEGPELVTGRTKFSLDLRRPGQLFAVVARCPVAGGRALRIDADAALALPGVRRVVPVSTGVAVVADSTWQAIRGRGALAIEWDAGPAAGFDSGAHGRELDAALEREGLASRRDGSRLPAAPRRLERRYGTGFQAHACMEPPNAIVELGEGAAEVWCGLQHPHEAQRRVARILGLGTGRVVVHPQRMGGGFGRKEHLDFVQEAAEIAKALGAGAVQLVWTRDDDLRHDYFQPASRHRLAASWSAAGAVDRWSHRVASPHIAERPREGLEDSRVREATHGAWDFPYDLPDVLVEHVEVPVPVRLGYWRGVQIYFNVFAIESFVDELAHELGRDPLELRRQMLGRAAPFAHRLGTVDRSRLLPVLDLAAERSGWGTPLPQGRGRGLACYVFDGQSFAAVVAEVTVAAGELTVDRVQCFLDCGQVINPLGLAGSAESSVAWALSSLWAETEFRDGAAVATNFPGYPVLPMSRMPAVEVHTVDSGFPPSGAGEIPVPGVAPAVANAIFAATGRRLRHLPLPLGELASEAGGTA
jgi:isoquinoline 1-oxidoreductase beta subunit